MGRVSSSSISVSGGFEGWGDGLDPAFAEGDCFKPLKKGGYFEGLRTNASMLSAADKCIR